MKQRAQAQLCHTCTSPEKVSTNGSDYGKFNRSDDGREMKKDADAQNGLLACTALIPVPRNPEYSAVPVYTIGWTAAFFGTRSFPMDKPIDVPTKVSLKDLFLVQILSGGVLLLSPSLKDSEGASICVMPEWEEVSSAMDEKIMKLLSRCEGNCLVLDIAASTGLVKDLHELCLLPVHLPPAYRNQTPSLTTRGEDNIGGKSLLVSIQPGNAEDNPLFTPNDQHDAALQLRSAIEATLTMSPAHLPHVTHVAFFQD